MSDPRPIRCVLVANRGEIAARIARTCGEEGIRTVGVYTEADQDSPHGTSCDTAERITDYLDGDAIVRAAHRAGADAVHPGYGFLAENEAFAQQVVDAGLVWIGPPASAIAAMGSKAAARQLMAEAGVAVVPGYDGEAQDTDTLTREAERIGYPILVKASAGGGGKGMSIVRDADGLAEAAAGAQRLAQGAFGDGRLILERYLERPRHIEVQVLADSHGTCLHLFERECSIQRRHQKVIEEAPSPLFGDPAHAGTRQQLYDDAVRAAQAVGYVGAGTVEFIVDEAGRHHFLEMNTRLQVEHPVTELICGLDLVALQLHVATGATMPLTQDQVQCTGWAMEARLYAEDPDSDYVPSTGRVLQWQVPAAGVRVDAGVQTGTEVGIHYDPMLAKVIAHGSDRQQACTRLQRGLEQLVVLGLRTNRSHLNRVLAHPGFSAGQLHTGFLDEHAQALQVPGGDEAVRWLTEVSVAALVLGIHQRSQRPLLPGLGTAFRNNRWPAPPVRMEVQGPGTCEQVALCYRELEPGVLHVSSQRWSEEDALPGIGRDLPEDVTPILAEGAQVRWRATRQGLWIEIDGSSREFAVSGDEKGRTWVHHPRGEGCVRIQPDFLDPAESAESGGEGSCRAPMPGKVVKVLVEAGQTVEPGDPLVVIEAMKMEQTLRAAAQGTVEQVAVQAGEQVELGQDLVIVTPAE